MTQTFTDKEMSAYMTIRAQHVGEDSMDLRIYRQLLADVERMRDATDYARNRLEMMSGDAWNIDGRDLKRNLQGVFAEYDAALSAQEKAHE